MGWYGCRDKEEHVELQLLEGICGNDQVARVRRVERASEDSYAPGHSPLSAGERLSLSALWILRPQSRTRLFRILDVPDSGIRLDQLS